jgi:hypothetical protein
VPKTGNLKTVQWRFEGSSGTWGSTVVRVSFQDLTGNPGLPDGTEDQYRDISSQPTNAAWYSSLGIMSSDGTDGGSKRSVTRGEAIAVVWRFQTFGTSPVLQFRAQQGGPYGGEWKSTYTALDTSGSYSITSGNVPVIVFQYDDDSFWIPGGCSPVNTTTSTTFNSSSNPKERGCYFVPNVPLRVIGFGVTADFDNAVDLAFYTGTTETDVYTIPHTLRASDSANAPLLYLTDADWDLSAGQAYRFHLRPGASNIAYRDTTINAANLVSNWYGLGAWYHSQRSSSDVFSETTTQIPSLIPIVERVSDGAGSGSGGQRVFGA